METRIYKGRDGWQAESMTQADANGQAWQISTHKSGKGVKCSAVQGQLDGAMFSYEMFGGKRLELAAEAGQCNENKVKAVHAAGLAEFARIPAETPSETTPAYVVGVGQIIFTDFINGGAESRRVIYEVTSPGHFKTVTLDGLQLHRDDRVKPYTEKFGIGTYYNEGEILPLSEIEILVEAATISTEIKRQKAEAASLTAATERARKIEEGSKIISAIPAGVTHVIIAEHEQDESDHQTDYHGSRTTETVYLSWSRHGRDLFPEMRKAAGKFEHTSKYAEAPAKPEDAGNYWTAPDENREKYSMGAGYYLGHSRYSGWNVSKSNIDGRSLEALQIAAAEGRFLCTEEAEENESPNFEPMQVEPGKIQVIEYSDKAVAVVGDTKPIKEQLKALGGRFNFRLTCGAGWVFPKTKLSELQNLLTA